MPNTTGLGLVVRAHGMILGVVKAIDDERLLGELRKNRVRSGLLGTMLD